MKNYYNKLSTAYKVIGMIAILFALPLAIYAFQKGGNILPASASGVRLFFSPNDINIPPNSSVNLLLDSGSTEISFVKVEVTFDKSLVHLSNEITTTNRLSTVIRKTDASSANSQGRATIILALSPDAANNAPIGTFEVAQLSFRSVTGNQVSTKLAIQSGSVQVVNVNAEELPASVTEATINLNPGSTSTSTPTSTSTSTATPTPTSSPTPTPPPNQTSTILKPIADTYVYEDYDSKNYGEESKVISDGYPKRIVLYKFNLRNIGVSRINSASLRIVPLKTRHIEKLFKVVPSSSWQENSVTWDTMPSLGSTIGEIKGRFNQGTAINVNLDPEEINQYIGRDFSIAIDDVSGGYILETASKESGDSETVLIIN